MFEVGKRYDFELMDDTDHDGRPCITTFPGREVLAIDGPLVKISAGADSHIVINTHSMAFVRATPKKDAPATSGRFSIRQAPPGKPE